MFKLLYTEENVLYVLILTKNVLGNILGYFFLELIWSPC
jgi:hypothetical protein